MVKIIKNRLRICFWKESSCRLNLKRYLSEGTEKEQCYEQHLNVFPKFQGSLLFGLCLHKRFTRILKKSSSPDYELSSHYKEWKLLIF